MYLKYERAVMTRREFVGGAATFAAMSGAFETFADDGNAMLEARKKWFREAQYGMMVFACSSAWVSNTSFCRITRRFLITFTMR